MVTWACFFTSSSGLVKSNHSTRPALSHSLPVPPLDKPACTVGSLRARAKALLGGIVEGGGGQIVGQTVKLRQDRTEEGSRTARDLDNGGDGDVFVDSGHDVCGSFTPGKAAQEFLHHPTKGTSLLLNLPCLVEHPGIRG